jgi:hypothetical protein
MSQWLALSLPACNFSQRSIGVVLVFAALAGSNEPLAAQPATAPSQPAATVPTVFSVSFAGPKNCPDRAEFVSEIQRRSRIAVPVGPGQQPEVVANVTLAQDGTGFRGHLELTTGTKFKERKLKSDTCAEVVSALALVTALAIDPNAETRPIESLPAPQPPPLNPPVLPPPTPDSGPIGPARPVDSRVLSQTSSRVEELWSLPLPAWVVRPAPKPRSLHAAFSLQADLLAGLTSEPLAGVHLSGGLAESRGLLWSLSLGFSYTTTVAPLQTLGLEADTELLRGDVELCLPGWSPVQSLRFFPCVGFGAGALQATFLNVSSEATTSGAGAWAGLGVGGRGVWLFSPQLGLDLGLGLQAPLASAEFTNNSRLIVASGPAAFEAQLGLVTEF